MAQHRHGDRPDVGEIDVEPPGQDGPRLGPQDQVLRGPRAGPVGQELVDLRASLAAGRAGEAIDQVHRVAHHRVGDRHAADQVLQPHHLGRVEHRPRPPRRRTAVVLLTIATSSSGVGYLTGRLNMNRSSCASGSG